jgi:hypothetical protein
MARAVIGGLITSTILTLIVVPVVYTYLDDLGDRFERWWTPRKPEPKRAAARAGRGTRARRYIPNPQR